MRKPKVLDLRVERVFDDNPPDVGSYSNEPAEGAIDLHERGIHSNTQYRYFNPACPEYAEEDLAELKSWEAYDFTMWGVRAVAVVGMEWRGLKLTARVESMGVWGLSSEDEDGLATCDNEEMLDLLAKLTGEYKIRVDEKMIADALANPKAVIE